MRKSTAMPRTQPRPRCSMAIIYTINKEKNSTNQFNKSFANHPHNHSHRQPHAMALHPYPSKQTRNTTILGGLVRRSQPPKHRPRPRRQCWRRPRNTLSWKVTPPTCTRDGGLCAKRNLPSLPLDLAVLVPALFFPGGISASRYVFCPCRRHLCPCLFMCVHLLAICGYRVESCACQCASTCLRRMAARAPSK